MTVAPTRSRRADILAAAEREFATAGFAGGRIERIAAQAGVNKQLIFHYFQSKDGLFDAVVTQALTRYEPRAQSSDHPAEEIRAVMDAVQAAATAIPGMLAAAQTLAWRDRQHARLRSAIEEGQRRGYFRDDLDPATVAVLAIAAALGHSALPRQGSVPLSAVIADFCAWR